MKLIKQSKKNNIKVFEHFNKNEGTYFVVTNYSNTKFVEKLSDRNLRDLNRYLKL
jgi:hypothetical protein